MKEENTITLSESHPIFPGQAQIGKMKYAPIFKYSQVWMKFAL